MKIIWALPQGSGYPFQVLAPAGCGLSSTIPNALIRKIKEHSIEQLYF